MSRLPFQRCQTLSALSTLTEHQQALTHHPIRNLLQLDPDILAQSLQRNQLAQSIPNDSTIVALLLAVIIVQISHQHLTNLPSVNSTTLLLGSLMHLHPNPMSLDQGTIRIALSIHHHLGQGTKLVHGLQDHYPVLILLLPSLPTMMKLFETGIGKTESIKMICYLVTNLDLRLFLVSNRCRVLESHLLRLPPLH